jgi:hypothetical protein
MLDLGLRGLVLATVGTASIAFAGAASATTLNVSGETTGVTGTVVINLDADQTLLGSGQYRFAVSLTNNDDAAISSSTITAFYLLSTPDSDFISTTSTRYSFGQEDVNLPPDNTAFSFCLETDSNNNCTGNNPGSGLAEGQTENFKLVVSASELPVFTGFALRWQEVNGSGSDKGFCTEDCGDDPVNVIPVPATLPLLAGGLGLAGWVLRRKQRKAA